MNFLSRFIKDNLYIAARDACIEALSKQQGSLQKIAYQILVKGVKGRDVLDLIALRLQKFFSTPWERPVHDWWELVAGKSLHITWCDLKLLLGALVAADA